MKRIMIIGAGRSQLPAITCAKNMNLEIIVIDGNPKAPGFKYADFAEIVSTRDIEESFKIAEEYNIDGVLTIATDSGVVTAATIAHRLELTGISLESAKIATDKYLMRNQFAENNVPSPDFGMAHNISEAKMISERVGFPLVVKPTDSAGSKGVKKVRNSKELNKAFRYAISVSYSKRVIIEDYMEGPEISIETLSFGGKHAIIAITDKIVGPPPYCVEMGHTIPSNLPEDIQKKACHITKKGLNALKIKDSGGHTEVKITENGLKIVEIGARLGGWIAADMVPLATGVNMVKGCINIALGNKPDLTHKFSKSAALRVFSSECGKVLKIKGEDKIRKMEDIKIFELFIKEGDIIKPLRSGFDRIGRIVATGRTRDETVQKAETAISLLEVVVS